MSAALSPQEVRLVERFHQYIRQEVPGSLFVQSEHNDFLLDTDVISVYPHVQAEHLAAARSRLNVDPHYDGLFLCVASDHRKDVPVDLCVLTGKGVFWWDGDARRRSSLSYADLHLAVPQLDYPNRGLKLVSDQADTSFFIRLYLHDALLHALASFLSGMQTVTSQALIDLNQASVEEIAALPLMSREKAERLVNRREAIQGYRHMDEIGQVLNLGFQEMALLAQHATLKPYRARRRPGRRVDY